MEEVDQCPALMGTIDQDKAFDTDFELGTSVDIDNAVVAAYPACIAMSCGVIQYDASRGKSKVRAAFSEHGKQARKM